MSVDILKILLVTCLVKVVTCVFFHEPSAIHLTSENGIDFGFSMGFQKGNNALVISAPVESSTMHASHHTIGKVYTCPVTNSINIKCDQANIDVKALAEYNLDGINPDQNFYLGATIAATQDYFLTCAPLWTSTIRDVKHINNNISFSFGTCFIYNGTANRYLGYLEQYPLTSPNSAESIISESFEGGVGWNTLADEENGIILIAKPFTPQGKGHVFFLNTKEPFAEVSGVEFSERGHNDILNLGFGMAAGKFFSNKTSYAVSYQDFTMTGKIYFLEKILVKIGTKKKKLKRYFGKDMEVKMQTIKKCEVQKNICRDVIIYNLDDVGSMFGYTMAAVDINGDGFTELIVGAPAQRDENKEYGAVYIYVGGSVQSMTKYMKTIFGVEEGARFGMTIATSDIDGDNFPEIIVSAPYEDSGNGAVYIISGYKVYKTFFTTLTRQVQVSKLDYQKIQKRELKLFGYSLQVIEDLDANGCNELAIGSPGSSTVLLFRSLQALKVNVILSTTQPKISDKDYKFDVKVCIAMEFNKKSTHIEGKISVTNVPYGNGVKLDKYSQYFINLSEILASKQTQHCQYVTVRLENSDIGVYRFYTGIEMFGLQESLNETDFSKTVAVFNSHSETNSNIVIERHCEADDCKPKLILNVDWSTHRSEYLLGSSENETFIVRVHNDGFNANGGCVHVYVDGAQIKRTIGDCERTGEFYTCRLRNPLRRNTTEEIALVLDMITNITNLIKTLEMKAVLFEDCKNLSTLISNSKLSVDYKLNTDVIHLTNENHNLDITEKSLSDEAPKILNVDQVYLIHNNGTFKWLDLDAIIAFSKAEFNFTVKEIVGIHNCTKLNEEGYQLKCKVDLELDSITKVILGVEIEKESIGKYIRDVKETKIVSVMSLNLAKGIINLESRCVSIVSYNKDTSVGHNKNLWIFIGILVGLLLLGGLCFILYKYGFFKGQNKKKLDRAKATVRQRSIKKSTTSQDTQRLHEDGNSPCDMEIVDDNAFEEPPSTIHNKDSQQLVEEKVQVHNEDKH